MSKTVVHDLNLNTFTIDSSNLQLRISAYGLLKNKNGALLLQKNPHFDRLNLPGGAIEKGEDLCEAVSREFKEETGYSVSVSKLIDVEQDFFTYDSKYFQNVCLFYKVDQSSDELVAIDNQEGDSESVVWISPADIDLNEIQPVFRNVIKQYLCL